MNTGDFDLNNFLQNYKQKKLPELTPYLKLDKLKGYKQITNDNMDKLIPGETYVKYIKKSNLFMDDELEMHVKGGILASGGTPYKKESYEKLENPYEWTHIVLRFAPFPTGSVRTAKGYGDKKIYDYEQRIFKIKINDYYLFYKHFIPK